MRRRFGYAVAGGLLSSGAPLGLLGLRLARGGHGPLVRRAAGELAASRADFTYVGASTAIVFALFGYVVGRQADRLADLSRTDSLTRLLNARGLFDHLHAEIARSRRYRTPLALLLVDLDGLKTINDEDGHRAGDQAIRHVADVIRAEMRATDVGARWGGDEFAIVAPNTPKGAAISLADRIRRLIAEPNGGRPVSVSVGLAAVGGRDTLDLDSATLMRNADAALYRAKAAGRNRIAVEGWDVRSA